MFVWFVKTDELACVMCKHVHFGWCLMYMATSILSPFNCAITNQPMTMCNFLYYYYAKSWMFLSIRHAPWSMWMALSCWRVTVFNLHNARKFKILIYSLMNLPAIRHRTFHQPILRVDMEPQSINKLCGARIKLVSSPGSNYMVRQHKTPLW